LSNALLKKARRREIPEELVRESIQETVDVVTLRESRRLLPEALDIAFRYQRSIYDSVYVALALQEGCPLVTADRRLYDALAPELADVLLWVEDVPA
jgi:predicted nucleic acid-binding protein